MAGSGLAIRVPNIRVAGRVAAKVEVEDESLVPEVVVDVALVVLQPDGGGAPGAGVGGVAVDVGGCVGVGP